MTSLAATLLLTALIQSALLAACIALLLRLLPALTAAARSALWIATFALMAILPFTTLLCRTTSTQPLIEPAHASPTLALALATLWAAAASWQLVRLARSWLHLHHVARTATPLSRTHPALVPPLSPFLFCARTQVELCTSPHVHVPSVAGFLHPRILLPTGLVETLSPEDLHQIVLHEMQHLHRHDDWTNLLQKLGLALFPLNPALWYADRRLCLERELACDDRVLRATGAGIAYATCLTNLAQQRILQRGLTLALNAFRRPSELARRIHRILTPARPASAATRFAATALTAVTLLAGAVTLTHTPRLVTFAPTPTTVATAPPISHFDNPAAHVVLTKASFPVAPRRPAAKRTHRHVHTTPAPQVILLNWHPIDFPAPRPTLINFRYAAVATPNGWLLIEI